MGKQQFTGLATSSALCLPFPLRPFYMAQIVVPRDLTKAEAERLCEFVMSLAIPAQEAGRIERGE